MSLADTLSDGKIGHAVLVVHPWIGSAWMDNASLVTVEGKRFISGLVWDTSQVGSSLYPDDYSGEQELISLPAGCLRKIGTP